jgi:hypothetical protein
VQQAKLVALQSAGGGGGGGGSGSQVQLGPPNATHKTVYYFAAADIPDGMDEALTFDAGALVAEILSRDPDGWWRVRMVDGREGASSLARGSGQMQAVHLNQP